MRISTWISPIPTRPRESGDPEPAGKKLELDFRLRGNERAMSHALQSKQKSPVFFAAPGTP